MKLIVQAVSDIGLVRERNEDSFLSDPDRGVFAVADGVGGVPGGDLASQTAMECLGAITREQPRPQDHTEWVKRINHEVRRAGTKRGYTHRIASTLTLMEFGPDGATLAHVGDSGAFRIRDNRVERLSEMHNIETEARARGEPVDQAGRYRFAITRCLGMDEPIKPQVKAIDVSPGDLYILATDGLTDLVKPREILELSEQTSNPKDLIPVLVERCYARAAHDNITAIAIRVESV
jgi:protein phosphatase